MLNEKEIESHSETKRTFNKIMNTILHYNL